MWLGVFCGVAGCALWGLIYIIPLLLPSYDPISLAMSRFAVFGAASLVMIYCFRRYLGQLTLRDWLWAFCLSFFGNAVYYAFLTQGIRMAGVPTSGMLMALIPLNVALLSNRAGNGIVLPWKKLIPPLLLILLGLWVGNIEEFSMVRDCMSASDYWIGFTFSFISMLLWTWFPIKNGQWLIRHPKVPPVVWTTVQGASIFPATLLIFLVMSAERIEAGESLLGPTPGLFIFLLLVAGIACGWGGMALWNLMSARLPVALSGQMIVFETIFSVIYTLIYRKQAPDWTLVLGLIILLVGVSLSLKCFRDAEAEHKAKIRS